LLVGERDHGILPFHTRWDGGHPRLLTSMPSKTRMAGTRAAKTMGGL
jgi:hypothetical protein